MTGQHLVLTPEKVLVSMTYATLGSRILAKIIDLFIWYLLVLLVGMVVFFAGALMSPDGSIGAGLGGLTVFAIVASFFLLPILLEVYWNGQTLGKKALNLRVVMVDGTPVTPLAAIYRNLIFVADAIPIIGVLAMFLNEKCQRVGDLAAGTIVVHQPKTSFGFRPAPHRFGLHPFEEVVPDLKGMTLEEYLAIKRLCDRFPELPATIQERSIQEVWVPFAKRFKVPNPPNVHPIYIMEATVMKYGRTKNLV